MAEPLRKDPDSQQPSSDPQRQFDIHRYGDTGRSSALKWWILALIVIVVVWFVIWGKGGSKSANQPGTNAATQPPVPVPAIKPSLDVPTMLSNVPKYVGQQVHLRDVLVQDVNGTSSVFVGPTSGQQVLVILKKGALDQDLQNKERMIPNNGIVTVTGTAQKPGSVKDLERTAKISRKQAEQVSKQGIVIEADRVEPQPM